MALLDELGLGYRDAFNIEQVEIERKWIEKSKKMIPDFKIVKWGKNEFYDSLSEIPTESQEFKNAQEVHRRLKGARRHTRLMLQIQSYIYGGYRPDVVEVENMDLVDENKVIVGEAGDISKTDSGSRFARFLDFRFGEENLTQWKFIHNPYNSENLRVYNPTDELTEAISGYQGLIGGENQ
jgi:hypothetical protein